MIRRDVRPEAVAAQRGQEAQGGRPLPALLAGADGGAVHDHVRLEAPLARELQGAERRRPGLQPAEVPDQAREVAESARGPGGPKPLQDSRRRGGARLQVRITHQEYC